MKKLIIFSMLLLSFCGGEAAQDEIVQTTEVTEMTYDKTYTCLLYTSPSPRDS